MSGRPSTSTRPSRGFLTVLIVIYGIFALSATARSTVQIATDFDEAPVAYLLSLVAALTYIAATVLLARLREDLRGALVLCSAELIGVLVVGTLSVADPALFPRATVWSGYGIGYGCVPLLLPVVALTYLVRRHLRTRRETKETP